MGQCRTLLNVLMKVYQMPYWWKLWQWIMQRHYQFFGVKSQLVVLSFCLSPIKAAVTENQPTPSDQSALRIIEPLWCNDDELIHMSHQTSVSCLFYKILLMAFRNPFFIFNPVLFQLIN